MFRTRKEIHIYLCVLRAMTLVLYSGNCLHLREIFQCSSGRLIAYHVYCQFIATKSIFATNGYFYCVRFFPLFSQVQNDNVEGLKEIFCNFLRKTRSLLPQVGNTTRYLTCQNMCINLPRFN